MKVIKTEFVLLAYLCVILFALLLVAGFFSWVWFIFAALALAGYFAVSILFLRCPACGSFINLDRLLYARRHDYHCAQCGQSIVVGK